MKKTEKVAPAKKSARPSKPPWLSGKTSSSKAASPYPFPKKK